MTISLKRPVTPLRAVDLDQYVSGDQVVWPAGSTTLNVSFTDTSGRLPGYGVLRLDYDNTVLTALRITRVSYRNYDRISQAGFGIAAADFAVFSGDPSETLFPMPRSPYTLLVTFAVNVAPLANEDVVFHLRPPEQLPQAMADAVGKAARPKARAALQKKLPSTIKKILFKKKPTFLSKLKSAGKAIWRRLPFVAGVGGLTDEVAGQLLAGLGQADEELEVVGASALDELLLGVEDDLAEEIAQDDELLDEMVGDMLDVLGAAYKHQSPTGNWWEDFE